MQISVDINDSFTIKCCQTTQMKALLYIYQLRMINMLFVEQISCQISLSKIFSDVSSLWRSLSKKIKFHRYADMGRTLETFRHHHMMILKEERTKTVQNNKMRTCRKFKTIENYKWEDYLCHVTNTHHRITLIKLSNQKLTIERANT